MNPLRLAIADGAGGFWRDLGKVHPLR